MKDSNMLKIVGRSSSHYTRVTSMFAHELGLAHELVPVHDMTGVAPTDYGGNPALKLPTLIAPGQCVFGAENVCRRLAELADREPRIVWPEEVRANLARNAQELVWHGMGAQVQLVFGTRIAKLPADNVYFTKARLGFEGALRWLDANVDAVLALLPAPRDVSLFEVTLFCLVEHLAFRPTLPMDAFPALLAFARAYGQRPSATATGYRIDPPPAP